MVFVHFGPQTDPCEENKDGAEDVSEAFSYISSKLKIFIFIVFISF